MKILHVTKKYKDALGGDVSVVSNLEKFQRLEKHDVYILTSNCDDIINASYVTKFGLKENSARTDTISIKRLVSLPALLLKSFQLIRKIRPEVIHSHSPEMGFVVAFAARFYRIPIVHTCHGVAFTDPSVPFLKRKLELFLLSQARFNKIIVLGPQNVESFEQYGFTNSLYVPNGVDIDFWQPLPQISKNAEFTFLTVGRLEDQKGYEYLLEAAHKLKDSYPNFKLIFAGDGTKKTDLTEKAGLLGLNENVEFVGSKNKAQIRQLYSKSNAFVLSSIWEGFPLTILEAWSMGLPVITTDVGDIKEIAGKYASVVPPRSPEMLARAMEAHIMSPQEIETNTSTMHWVEQFSWRIISKDIEAIYEG